MTRTATRAAIRSGDSERKHAYIHAYTPDRTGRTVPKRALKEWALEGQPILVTEFMDVAPVDWVTDPLSWQNH